MPSRHRTTALAAAGSFTAPGAAAAAGAAASAAPAEAAAAGGQQVLPAPSPAQRQAPAAPSSSPASGYATPSRSPSWVPVPRSTSTERRTDNVAAVAGHDALAVSALLSPAVQMLEEKFKEIVERQLLRLADAMQASFERHATNLDNRLVEAEQRLAGCLDAERKLREDSIAVVQHDLGLEIQQQLEALREAHRKPGSPQQPELTPQAPTPTPEATMALLREFKAVEREASSARHETEALRGEAIGREVAMLQQLSTLRCDLWAVRAELGLAPLAPGEHTVESPVEQGMGTGAHSDQQARLEQELRVELEQRARAVASARGSREREAADQRKQLADLHEAFHMLRSDVDGSKALLPQRQGGCSGPAGAGVGGGSGGNTEELRGPSNEALHTEMERLASELDSVRRHSGMVQGGMVHELEILRREVRHLGSEEFETLCRKVQHLGSEVAAVRDRELLERPLGGEAGGRSNSLHCRADVPNERHHYDKERFAAAPCLTVAEEIARSVVAAGTAQAWPSAASRCSTGDDMLNLEGLTQLVDRALATEAFGAA